MEEKDSKILLGRVIQLSSRCIQENYPTHSEFLSLSEQNYIFRYLKSNHHGNLPSSFHGAGYLLYGGSEEADRKMIFFFPEYLTKEETKKAQAEGENIVLLHVFPKNPKFADHLTHRDFLGALMHLGYERERIGDILTDGLEGYIFLEKSVSEDISSLLTKVRHTCVDTEILKPSLCPFKPKFREISFTVASNRIDAILKEVFHLSRRSSQEMLSNEMVFVNGFTVKGNDFHLTENDRVSVRGEGKFIFLGEGHINRKGRISCRVNLYD